MVVQTICTRFLIVNVWILKKWLGVDSEAEVTGEVRTFIISAIWCLFQPSTIKHWLYYGNVVLRLILFCTLSLSNARWAINNNFNITTEREERVSVRTVRSSGLCSVQLDVWSVLCTTESCIVWMVSGQRWNSAVPADMCQQFTAAHYTLPVRRILLLLLFITPQRQWICYIHTESHRICRCLSVCYWFHGF